MNKRFAVGAMAAIVATAGLLTGCSSNDSGTTTTSTVATTSAQEHAGTTSESASATSSHATTSAHASESASAHASAQHNHSLDGGPAPAGMVKSTNAKFKDGEKITITADHGNGTKGAEGEVVGAFDTTVYEVDYTPVGGGAKVTNHKWVVQEELDAPAGTELKAGDTVKLKANHMEGMEGAEATIVSAKKETVYMVNYTANGQHYTNHKWFTQDELKAR